MDSKNGFEEKEMNLNRTTLIEERKKKEIKTPDRERRRLETT